MTRALEPLLRGERAEPILSFFVDEVSRHDDRLLDELERLVREKRRQQEGGDDVWLIARGDHAVRVRGRRHRRRRPLAWLAGVCWPGASPATPARARGFPLPAARAADRLRAICAFAIALPIFLYFEPPDSDRAAGADAAARRGCGGGAPGACAAWRAARYGGRPAP